jgi:hypothetical protein
MQPAARVTRGAQRLTPDVRQTWMRHNRSCWFSSRGNSMPKGHSGRFFIDTAALKRLLHDVPGTTPIGMLAGGTSGSRLRLADATEVVHLVEQVSHERIAVEEQDHSFFIIHVSDEPTLIWISVKSDSPIFGGLAQQQTQWKLDHPTR